MGVCLTTVQENLPIKIVVYDTSTCSLTASRRCWTRSISRISRPCAGVVLSILKSSPLRQILPIPTKQWSPSFVASALLTAALLCFGCFFRVELAATTETESHQSAPLPEGYVGEKQCAPCHREIYDTFKKLGMGQSWLDPSTAPLIENYEINNSFQHAKSGFYYKMLPRREI